VARHHLTQAPARGQPNRFSRFSTRLPRPSWRLLSGLLIVVPLLLLALLLAVCDFWIRSATADRIYFDAAEVPAHEVALVLGTSPFIAEGRPNLFFLRRMDAAADLYHQGKARRLILSGGAAPGDYDEPEEMRQALLAKDVPDEALVLDRAGYRTYDSVVRARAAFGAESLVVVSQDFHVQRAIFIADREGVEAIGFAAANVAGLGGAKVNLRELLARVKAILDLYLFPPPAPLPEAQ